MQQTMFIDRFREIVQRHGDQIAIVDRGRPALTYAQLWRLSGQIAGRLIHEHAGPETVVGLAFSKSPEMIAAILGCWRTRAAYVPLDSALPETRLRHMVQDAGVSLILTDRDSRDVSPFSEDRPPIHIANCAATPLVEDELSRSQASDLAWVIFTSGTTGRPRGVQVEHRAFVNVLDAQRRAFYVEASSRVLLLYSTSFDASLSDIGTALLSGAALCIEDTDSLSRCGSILQLIRDRGVTHADIPPSLLALHRDDSAPECLETVVIGGEVCPAEVVRKWADRVRLVNVYGPTEATICTSLCECTPGWTRPLLGQPLPGIQYRVVDPDNQPVTRGQSGELLIAGDCLARGYADCPDETGRKFVGLDDHRWFRTGDHVRRDDDGEYVFLGRLDRQLKVRGFRIEAEEVEAALLRIEGVTRCAVVQRAVGSDSTDNLLVAFLEANREINTSLVREQLRSLVPEAMVPARFELIDRIPVTVSGKPDLKALEGLDFSLNRTRNCDESELLSLVRSVIGNPALRADDDIFAAGADSLSVLAISASTQSRGYSLTPLLISQKRTVSRLLANSDHTDDAEACSADWLRADVLSLLPSSESSNRADSPIAPHVTLLTGATGFLGTRVLAEWLYEFDGTVVCLVRAQDDQAAAVRLTQALDQQCVELSADQWSRIEAVAGDISRERFGWSSERWNSLAARVDTVVHNAAAVHVFASYQQLRPANVVGTANVLKFSMSHRIKRLHYASTLSVFVGTDRNSGVAAEADDLTKTKEVYGGYAQSKWAAEVLVRSASQSVPLNVYRFGLLTGDSRSGRFSENDLFAMTVRGLACLRCLPVDAGQLAVDITPVDFAARAMVAIARHQATETACSRNAVATWHIANPQSLSSRLLFETLEENCPGVARVSSEEFMGRVRSDSGADSGAACLSLCRWLSDSSAKQNSTPLDLFQATGITFEMTRTRQILERIPLSCPPPDRTLIRRYVTDILEHASTSGILQ